MKKFVLMMINFYSNGTSMISLIIPPRDQIPRIARMLVDEYGTASNIKSRVNRLVCESTHVSLDIYNSLSDSQFSMLLLPRSRS